MTGDGGTVIIDRVSDDETVVDAVQPEGDDPREPRRRWHRSTSDRYLGGVAAGVARWLDVDPLVVRVGLVVVSVFWPLAVVIYAALWLLAPSDREPRALLRRVREPGALREVLGALALAVAVLLMLPDLGPGGSAGLQLGVVLVGAGLALLARPTQPPDPPGPPAPPDQSAPNPPPGGGRSFLRPRLPAVRLRRAHPRQRPFLTPLALSLIVLLVGVVAGLEAAGVGVTAPGTVISLLMVLVGGTLVISAWWGRARSLLLLVPVLLAGWVAWSLTDIPRYPGIGERRHTLVSAADVEDYTLGAGSLSIDAGRLALRPGQRVDLEAALTAGRLAIEVPFDAALRLDGRLGLGQVEVWDDRVGAYGRQYDTGPTANRRLDRRLAPLAPLCWPASLPGRTFPPATISPSTISPTTTMAAVHRTPDGEPCEPRPASADPPVITVQFAIGAGILEVHRVEARD